MAMNFGDALTGAAAALALVAGCKDTDPAAARERAPPPTAAAPVPSAAPAAAVPKWYEGGTLTNAGALEWQQATSRNKLASAADFIAKMWLEKRLERTMQARIRDLDDIRDPAHQLVAALDKALAEEPDPVKNRELYANQTVSGAAATAMILMGWIGT